MNLFNELTQYYWQFMNFFLFIFLSDNYLINNFLLFIIITFHSIIHKKNSFNLYNIFMLQKLKSIIHYLYSFRLFLIKYLTFLILSHFLNTISHFFNTISLFNLISSCKNLPHLTCINLPTSNWLIVSPNNNNMKVI